MRLDRCSRVRRLPGSELPSGSVLWLRVFFELSRILLSFVLQTPLLLVACEETSSLQTFCATIVHGAQRKADILHERIMSTAYEMARVGTREVEGFPLFGPIVKELQSCTATKQGGVPLDGFQVSVPRVDGTLVIRDQFFTQFENVIDSFEETIAEHNEKFNPEGRRLKDKEEPEPQVKEEGMQMAVTVEADDPMTPEKLAALPDARHD